MNDMRKFLESLNQFMPVFSALIGIVLGISIAIALVSIVGRFIVRTFEQEEYRKTQEQKETEKRTGIPLNIDLAWFHIFMNRLLDRVLGEPRKRKNEDIIAERLSEPGGDGDIVYMETGGLTDDLKR